MMKVKSIYALLGTNWERGLSISRQHENDDITPEWRIGLLMLSYSMGLLYSGLFWESIEYRYHWMASGRSKGLNDPDDFDLFPSASNRKAWLWWRPATLSATYINPAATTTHDAKQTRNKTCNRRRHPLRRHLQRRCVWTRTWTRSNWILRLIASTIITPLSFQEAIWPCAHGQDCRHIVSRSKLLYLSCFALRSNTHKLFASTYKIDSISMNTTLLSLNLHYSSTSELTG